MSVQYPYRAVICGEEHIIDGWSGGNLLTDKGEFVLSQLYSNYSIQTATLVEVGLLQSDEKGGWLLNGYDLRSLQSLPAGSRLSAITSGEVLRVHKGKIRAIAWVQTAGTANITEQLDTILGFWKTASRPAQANAEVSIFDALGTTLAVGLNNMRALTGWSKPIWLTKFHLVTSIAESKSAPLQLAKPLVEAVKPVKHKVTKIRQPRPVARFENDFSLAIIPQQNRTEKPLTIEPELRDLIMKIMAAGGSLPRTKLRSDKSDTYQPEKLLKSKVAKSLIKAGLLGTEKSGRTTVFWVKPHAS